MADREALKLGLIANRPIVTLFFVGLSATLARPSAADVIVVSRLSEAKHYLYQGDSDDPSDGEDWVDLATFDGIGPWSVVLPHGTSHADSVAGNEVRGEFRGRRINRAPALASEVYSARTLVEFEVRAAERVRIDFAASVFPNWSATNLRCVIVPISTGIATFDLRRDGDAQSDGSGGRFWQPQTWEGTLPAGSYTLTIAADGSHSERWAGHDRGFAHVDLVIAFQGPACVPDFNGDGFIDFFDYLDFVTCLEDAPCPEDRTSDVNRDGFSDVTDWIEFVAAFEQGC
jgi:hypothetical protein